MNVLTSKYYKYVGVKTNKGGRDEKQIREGISQGRKVINSVDLTVSGGVGMYPNRGNATQLLKL